MDAFNVQRPIFQIVHFIDDEAIVIDEYVLSQLLKGNSVDDRIVGRDVEEDRQEVYL